MTTVAIRNIRLRVLSTRLRLSRPIDSNLSCPEGLVLFEISGIYRLLLRTSYDPFSYTGNMVQLQSFSLYLSAQARNCNIVAGHIVL